MSKFSSKRLVPARSYFKSQSHIRGCLWCASRSRATPHYIIMLKGVLLLTFIILVHSQVEQNVFAQFTRHRDYKVQVKLSTVEPAEHSAPPQLNVLRTRRSFFDRDVDHENNNALLLRMKPRMSDPNWVPDIRPRKNYLNKRANGQIKYIFN